jgi:hypothetical protein
MECATVNCDPDGGYCTILKSSNPIARKEHKCHECYRIIQAGEKYLSETFLYDGKIDLHKTCADCVSIRENFFSGGWVYGETKAMLREHVMDHDGDVPESCLAALTPGAREMVCDLIAELDEDEE